MAIIKIDRFRGAMNGALGGDALGAPYETKKAMEIGIDLIARDGLQAFDYIEPFKNKRQIRKGQPTDDSELTAALAQGLLSPEFDAAGIYARLRGFIHGHGTEGRKSILTDGPAYGSGGTLRSALRAETYEESFLAFREGNVSLMPSNGSLMRNTPIALRYMGHPDMIVSAAKRQSCITHVHPAAQVACMVHALLLWYILLGVDGPNTAWKYTQETIRSLFEQEKATKDRILKSDLETVLAFDGERPHEDEIWPNTGGAMLSLRIALWAFLTASDFRDGLTKSISVGGDTDTYGAIAGGLLGAHFGIDGIPKEWRDVLIGREIMTKLADDLYALAYN